VFYFSSSTRDSNLFSSLIIIPFTSQQHNTPWLPSHRVLFSPLPCFSPPLSSTLLSPGKGPTFLSEFITLTNPPCALACIRVKFIFFSFPFCFSEAVCYSNCQKLNFENCFPNNCCKMFTRLHFLFACRSIYSHFFGLA